MIKNRKKVNSFAVFAKIILYITIFFRKLFEGGLLLSKLILTQQEYAVTPPYQGCWICHNLLYEWYMQLALSAFPYKIHQLQELKPNDND